MTLSACAQARLQLTPRDRARDLPDSTLRASSLRLTTPGLTAPLTCAVVLVRTVPHGVANHPRIAGKDGLTSPRRPGPYRLQEVVHSLELGSHHCSPAGDAPVACQSTRHEPLALPTVSYAMPCVSWGNTVHRVVEGGGVDGRAGLTRHRSRLGPRLLLEHAASSCVGSAGRRGQRRLGWRYGASPRRSTRVIRSVAGLLSPARAAGHALGRLRPVRRSGPWASAPWRALLPACHAPWTLRQAGRRGPSGWSSSQPTAGLRPG
jgi:hypothetical protein